jgi:hypothetical protein
VSSSALHLGQPIINTQQPLSQTDLDAHDKLAIDREILVQAGVRRVSDSEARDILSKSFSAPGRFDGLEYPYIDPMTGRRVTSRIRLDHPDQKPDGTLENKYRSPYRDNRHLYFTPGAAALLKDTSVPVVIVEAEKSALAIASAAQGTGRQVLVLATGGCWGWRGTTGKAPDGRGARCDVKGPLSDFHYAVWTNRRAIVLFDARPNSSVLAARFQLGLQLEAWGADVRDAHLPDNDERANGPDDFVGLYGDHALWRVIDSASPIDFERNQKDQIVRDSLDNIRLALHRLGMRLSYDEFGGTVLINGREADEDIVNRLWVAIDDAFGFRPQLETLNRLIDADARKSPVHPVREYLDSLIWDATPRIDTWLTTYGGAEASDYVRAVGRLVLIAAVRRVRQPGCKFDELLVLESKQGTLKSSALRVLCPNKDWFSDDLPLGIESKEVIERTAGKWIIEAAEMHGNRGRETEQLKAFLSRQVDGPVRMAYARRPTKVPRQFILIGTTNATAYLKDSTGGRRFWPVRVQQFDIAALEETATKSGQRRSSGRASMSRSD